MIYKLWYTYLYILKEGQGFSTVMALVAFKFYKPAGEGVNDFRDEAKRQLGQIPATFITT